MSKEIQPIKLNHVNRADNISHFHGGFLNGVYYDLGRPRIGKGKVDKIRIGRGTIYDPRTNKTS